MNNVFNTDRFGKMISYDTKTYFKNFGLTLLILTCIPLIPWIFSSIFNFNIPPQTRAFEIAIVFGLTVILCPALAYGIVNQKREGYQYALLPASNLEKYISMCFFCLIITPILSFIGNMAIDSILYLLPIGGYEQNIMNYFNDTKIEFLQYDLPLTDWFFKPSLIILTYIISYWSSISIFMFGNMVFKSHKTIKMIAILIGLNIVLLPLVIMSASHFFSTDMFQDQNESMIAQSIYGIAVSFFNLKFIADILIILVMQFLTYYKIKTQKY